MKIFLIVVFILLSPVSNGFAKEVYKELKVEVRFYAPSSWSKANGGHKNTSSNTKPKSNRTLAISRDLYRKGVNFGTKVFIPNLGFYIVEDLMGPKAKGNQIDICVDSKKEAFKLGVLKNKTIYLILN